MAVTGVLLLSGVVVLGQLQSLSFGKSGIGDLSPGRLAELGVEPSPAAESRSPEKCSESDHSDLACRGDKSRYGPPEDYYDGVDTGAATGGVDYTWKGGNIVNNTLEELLLYGELDERCQAKLIEEFPAIEAYRARPPGTFRALTPLQSCPPRETSSTPKTRLGPDGRLMVVFAFLVHSSAIAAFATAESLLSGIEHDLAMTHPFQPRFIFHVDSSSPDALHAEVERWVIAHSAVAAAVPQPLDVEYMAITQAEAWVRMMQVCAAEFGEADSFVTLSESHLMVADSKSVADFFRLHNGVSFPGKGLGGSAGGGFIQTLVNDITFGCGNKLLHVGWRIFPHSQVPSIYGGEVWSFWSGEFVRWVAQPNNQLVRATLELLRYFAASDEYLLATLFHGSPFCHRRLGDDAAHFSAFIWAPECVDGQTQGLRASKPRHCGRMDMQPLDWWSAKRPIYLTEKDAPMIVREQPLFARKVRPDASARAVIEAFAALSADYDPESDSDEVYVLKKVDPAGGFLCMAISSDGSGGKWVDCTDTADGATPFRLHGCIGTIDSSNGSPISGAKPDGRLLGHCTVRAELEKPICIALPFEGSPWQNTRFDPSGYYDTYARTMGGEVGIAPCDPLGRGQTWVFRPNGMEIAVRDSNMDISTYSHPGGPGAAPHTANPLCLDATAVPGSLKLRPCGSTATIHLVKPPDGFHESYDGSDLVNRDEEEGEGDEDDDGGDSDDNKPERHVEPSTYKNPLTGKGRTRRASRDKEGVDKAQLGIKSFGLQTAVTDEAEDIVWYLGGRNPYSWDPKDQSLGGSEQAVVELSTAWAARGITVAVYGQFSPSRVYRGVVYRDARTFRGDLQYKDLIIWRALGADLFNPMLPSYVPYRKLRVRMLIHDVHDIFLYPTLGNNLATPPTKPLGPKASAKLVAKKFDKVMVRSQYHADRLKLTKYNRTVVVIKNGLRVKAVQCDGRVKREPLRFIYASDYSRGLVQMLKWLWPELKKLVPEAELHVFYGMSGHSPQFQSRMSKLFRQDSVIDHGRQNISVLTAARCRSTFHLYFSRTHEETDCISIRESAAAGVIPILSVYGIFAERPGLHVEGDPMTKTGNVEAARIIARLLNNPAQFHSLRESVIAHETQDWDQTAAQRPNHI